MVLSRISNHVSLAGAGGLLAPGRWHSRGRRVVYCAESPAAALLEILVHFELDVRDLPVRYRLLKINVADSLQLARVTAADLPPDWVENTASTRAIGDRWLATAAAPLLSVPSAIVAETSNVLLNPAHRDASRVAIVQTSDHVIDRRLLE